MARRLGRDEYTIGWVCPLPIELTAAQEMLDEEHQNLPSLGNDTNIYSLGRIGEHNVVLAGLPAGQTGTNPATAVATQMRLSFPSVRFGLMVGIGGGVPSKKADVRLGDVVVSKPENGYGGVIQYDFGKSTPGRFKRTGFLSAPPPLVLGAVTKLQSLHNRGRNELLPHLTKLGRLPIFVRENAGDDVLFEAGYNHEGEEGCASCAKIRQVQRRDRVQTTPAIHYGTIASANQVMRDGTARDTISTAFKGVLCFEMEAAGLMNNFPCLVIRGICDYADSHKNKLWQPYAAATAAAYAKELLAVIPAAEPFTSTTLTHETAPNPTILISFPPDADFIQRGTLLDQIHQACSVPGSRTALLAIKYAYQTREEFPKKWVFWVYASDAARLEQGFRSIANLVKIPQRLDLKSNVLELVYDWLHDERNGQWLLILDNVDDADFLVDPTAGRDGRLLKSYLPQCQHGSILVSSQNKQAAIKLVEERNIIEVGAMTEEAATDLLRQKLRSTQDGIADLARLLDCMPLAIVQAAAYIMACEGRCSVTQYVEKFRSSEQKRPRLLKQEGGRLRRDEEAEHSIVVAVQISLEKIRQKKQSAADLLSLMSFFDSQDIPEELLRSQVNNDQHEPGLELYTPGNYTIEGSESSDDNFDIDVQILRDFFFISCSASGTTFGIHKLVQLAIREWLQDNNQFAKWQQQSIKNLNDRFIPGDCDSWATTGKYFPHVQTAVMRPPKNKEALLLWASLLREGSIYAEKKGLTTLAIEMSKKAWKTQDKLLGGDEPDTLNSMVCFGSACTKAGYHRVAIRILLKVLKTHKRVLGCKHPQTLISMAELASAYRNQGQWRRAEKQDLQVLHTSKRVLGISHEHTLIAMSNLASTFCHQSRWSEAGRLEKQRLRIGRKIFGKHHPETLDSMSRLAWLYEEQSRFREAEKLRIFVLKGRIREHGKDDPRTLNSMLALALTIKELGKKRKAVSLMKDCVERAKQVLGEDDADTKNFAKGLAMCLEEVEVEN